MDSHLSSTSSTSTSNPSLVHYRHLSLQNRINTNLQFKPDNFHPLSSNQQTLLDNLWSNRSDTDSMIHTLNCLNLCFADLNNHIDDLQNQISNISLVSDISPTANILALEKEVKIEKKKNDELTTVKEEFAKIILEVTKESLEQQYQYLYLPHIPRELKSKLFQTVRQTKQQDLINCQEKIRAAYEQHEKRLGVSYSFQTLELHTPCPCQFCTNHFQIVTLSLHLAYVTSFYQWSIRNLLDYGQISKLIISRDSYLEEQVSSLQHPGLQQIIWTLFEDGDIFSITLLIQSVGPYFEDLMDTAKHIIEIIITPRSFTAEQKDEDYPPILADVESSLLHHRLYLISNLQAGIYRPRWHSHLAYQDKDMMVFLNLGYIKGKFYHFQFYCQQKYANLFNHIQTTNWYSLRQTGDFQSVFQRIPRQNVVPDDENYFEGMDHEEVRDMMHRLTADNWG